jgi:hypothetical protein
VALLEAEPARRDVAVKVVLAGDRLDALAGLGGDQRVVVERAGDRGLRDAGEAGDVGDGVDASHCNRLQD